MLSSRRGNTTNGEMEYIGANGLTGYKRMKSSMCVKMWLNANFTLWREMHEVEGIEEERKVHHSVSRKICDVMGLRGRAVRWPQGHHSDIWKYKKI